MIFFPFTGLGRRIGLYLLYPVTQIRSQTHTSEYKTSYHSQQNTADYVDKCHFQTERTEEHGHSYLIHQRRCNKESEGDTQRNAAFDKSDEQRYG